MRKHRRALVTGASSGIGAAFAHLLAPETDLLLTGRNDERLAAVAGSLRRPGRNVQTVVANLGREAELDHLAKCAEAFGPDLLINNAGRGGFGAVLSRSADYERDTTLVNVVAPVWLTGRLLPSMLAQAERTGKRAGLINVASTAAFAPVPFFATYAASKSFVLSWTEALTQELRGEPVDILALCPGATRTAFGRSAGFRGGTIPGAIDPRIVARSGLGALGYRTIKVTGLVDELALGALVPPRQLVASTLGTVMRLADRFVGPGRESAPER